MRARWLLAVLLFGGPAHADAVDTLKDFVREARTGQASFTQTVTSPDGKRKKTSSGSFEFARPNRFRFAYTKPFEQLILADGQKVWIYDTELNQVSSLDFAQAFDATPAALLAGSEIERDFDLKALPDHDGLAWVEALPRAENSTFQSVRVGFRGSTLAALEISDGFGQTSLLQLVEMVTNMPLAVERFRFVIPVGADVIEQ
jgi:outer membrane lipoprotein carrier protein